MQWAWPFSPLPPREISELGVSSAFQALELITSISILVDRSMSIASPGIEAEARRGASRGRHDASRV
jgi:hypothetical protein